jgi:predicted MFS family arabinose efflux permease
MRNIFIVSFSALLIFVFTAADNAVSPLVAVFGNFYHVPEPTVLYLISSCTFGIVLGILVGPILIAKYRVNILLILATLFMSIAIALFIATTSFTAAIIWRIMFGITSGCLASVIWWITFQGVSGKTTDAMVVVTLTARPAALCLGIPLAAITTSLINWQATYVIFLVLILVAGTAIFWCIKDLKAAKTSSSTSIIEEYQSIFRVPAFFPLYIGILCNSCSYFGFYALAGIWFSSHYHLTFMQISSLFLFIGGAEILINFISPWLYRTFAYRSLFTCICAFNIVTYMFFVFGFFTLWFTMIWIMTFIMLNRILLFGIIRTLPMVFSIHTNQTTLGSLLTLTLWMGFALISSIQGKLLPIIGIQYIESLLLLTLIVGVSLIWLSHRKWVFQRITTIR